jgi:leucyl aminopeptidase (aminopeptidase T)
MTVRDPIRLTLNNGRIQDFAGGASAAVLEDWFAKWDEEIYHPAHVSWGTHVEGAEWIDSQFFSTADAESYPGMIIVAFGHNYFDTDAELGGLGGANHSSSHIDLMCLGQNLHLDGEKIIEGGTIVHPQCV